MVEGFVSGFDVPPTLLLTSVERMIGAYGGPLLVFFTAIVMRL